MADPRRIHEVIGAFQAAGLGEGGWAEALALLASATGSRAGQLIGFGSQTALRFNWTTGIPDACLEEFASGGWADPCNNPRVRFGAQAGELSSLAEADFAPDTTGLPFYEDFSRRWDLPFSCITNLVRDDHGLIGLAVVRSARDGPIRPDQRAVFDAVAPHARHAVRTQLALEERAAKLLQGALEALDLAVVVCERHGRVRASSTKAKELLHERRWLGLQEGRLVAARARDGRALAQAIAHAIDHPAAGLHKFLALRSADEQDAVLAEVAPMPGGDFGLGFQRTSLLILRPPRAPSHDQMAAVAALMYRLSPAEAAIAADLVAGRTATLIAARRGVAVGTVRSQIQSVFRKVGVERQIELVAVMGPLCS